MNEALAKEIEKSEQAEKLENAPQQDRDEPRREEDVYEEVLRRGDEEVEKRERRTGGHAVRLF